MNIVRVSCIMYNTLEYYDCIMNVSIYVINIYYGMKTDRDNNKKNE